jgi:hypothetical protein
MCRAMLRLRKPSRRQGHIIWLLVSAFIDAWVARGAPPVFFALFFVVWLVGYLVLVRVRGW